MSDVIEKTLASISGVLLSTVAPRNTDISPGFNNLVRTVSRAASKIDEEKTVKKELELLKSKLAQPDIGLKKTKEFLIRLMYCEMLGQSASFGYIYALKLAQQGGLVNKRVGYLAVSLFLHENHELVLLLINTIQRDLHSTNMLDNCMALGVLCKLGSIDMIPIMLPLVEEKLQHPRALVRKKAVMVLHRFYHKAPHLVQHMQDNFKQALCDRDPTVMCAALQIYYDLLQSNPSDHLHLVRPLVSILDQIISKKLSVDFEYHGVSAPWMQILILKMLAKLGAADKKSCSLIHGALEEMFQKASLSQNIAFAVQYECILTVTSIHPTPDLLEQATKCINKFIRSRSNNLKYLGISALSAILEVSPTCAVQHQTIVMNCLDDNDTTIKFKTLELLYRMTDKSNVSVVCKKLMAFLSTTKEEFLRRDLVNKIGQLAEKYHPTVRWYMDAMTMLILTGGNIVPTNIVHNIIRSISQANNGLEVREHAMQLYLPFAVKQTIPDMLVQLIAWVLGDCCSVSGAPPAEQLLGLLCSLLDRPYDDDSTRGWVVAAMTKVVAHGQVITDDVAHALKTYKRSPLIDLRQRIYELKTLCDDMGFIEAAVPSEAGEYLQFDSTLTFLDDYVSEALENGAAPYKPRHQRHTEKQPSPEEVKPMFAGLNFKPYENPPSIASGNSTTISSPADRDSGHPSTPEPSITSAGSGKTGEQMELEKFTGLKLEGVRHVWGQKGYSKPKSSPKRRSEVKEERTTSSDGIQLPVMLPGKSGIQPSIEMSGAQAVGTTSKQGCGNEETEEDRQKKELAIALFGGMQRSMVMSQAPIDRRKQQVLQREENNLIDQLSEGQRTDGSSNNNVLSREDLITYEQPNTNTDFRLEIEALANETDPNNFDPLQQPQFSTTETDDPAGLDSCHNLDEGIDPSNYSSRGSIYDDFKVDLQSALGTSSLKETRHSNDITKNVNLDTAVTNTSKRATDNNMSGRQLAQVQTSIDQDQDLLLNDTKHSLASISKDESARACVTDDRVSLLDVSSEEMKSNYPDEESQLPPNLASYPNSKENTELCSDGVVRVTLCKVWKPDLLGLVFFINNQHQTRPVHDLVIKLDLPSNFKYIRSSDNHAPLSIDAISSGSTKCVLTDVTCQTPALNMSLGGQLAYKDYTNTSKRLFFNMPVSITDLLRPYEMNTSDYGQLWPTLTHDHRLTFEQVNVDTMSKVMNHIAERLQLFPVEVIGREGIASGTLLGSAPCLLHSKLTGYKLECWIKSASQLLSDAIAKCCHEGIASGTLLGSAPCLLHSKLTGYKLECWIKSASQLLSDAIAKCCNNTFR